MMMRTVLPSTPIMADVKRSMTYDQIVEAGDLDVFGGGYIESSIVRVSREVELALAGCAPVRAVADLTPPFPPPAAPEVRVPAARRALSSSLSRSGPPVPLRNVASWPLAIDDVQTVITR
jgi:hypothetical protein